MSNEMDRRGLLRVSAGAAVLAAAGMAGLAGTSAAETAGRGTELPPVPGMLGDRLANELWYQLDEATLYTNDPELNDAYLAMMAHLGGDLENSMLAAWNSMVTSPDYPRNYAHFMAPVRGALQKLSDVQAMVFDTYYPRRDIQLAEAYGMFGQGVLFDPRRAVVKQEVHTMGGNPPHGYHVWFAYLRAMMVLGIDQARWRDMGPYVAYGWAAQSIAKPDQRAVNPPLPAATMRRLRRTWLCRSIRQLDRDFQSFPYPAE
ncbi:MAG: hypothetical protein WBA97_25585 [Actinophytocola sp.]|uniref:hypothetical protein n=1 Tax=Actinophytocola sp. TaxID=1872138 RepID=UPI003C70B29E